RGDGDGGPPEPEGGTPGGRRITARGDLLYFENNVINGGFTGIRREAAGGAAQGRETDARNTGDGA
ncbi:hypothetical protein GTY57_21295, partial [Streptomyces sp. SID5475]|nr:hypothetical protein [Streptomyces sp. SID5475]